MSFIGVLSDSPQMLVYRYYATATQGQTSVTVRAYTAGQTDVWVNGVKMVDGDDFTATDGTTINFTVALNLDDIVEVKTYEAASVANRQTMVTFEFVASSAGQTFTGLDYTVGLVMVSRNGFSLPSGDYTAGDGATLTVPSAAIGDDIILHGFSTFEVANALTQAVADGRYLQAISGVISRDIEVQSGANDGRQVKLVGPTNNALQRHANSTAQQYSSGLNNTDYIVYDDTALAYRMVINSDGQMTVPSQPLISGCIGPAVSHPSADQKLPFGTFWASQGITYDSGTRRFTVPISGKYRITLNPFKMNGVQPARVKVGINNDAPSNGQNYGMCYTNDSAYQTMCINSVVPLAANDYIVFYLEDGQLYNNTSDDYFNQFSIELIG